MEYQGKLKGIKGEVFPVDGRVAGCVPPMGITGAIAFEIFGEYPGQTPRWADMQVGKLKCRINPDICEAAILSALRLHIGSGETAAFARPGGVYRATTSEDRRGIRLSPCLRWATNPD